MVTSIDDDATFVVETDASEYAIATCISQSGRPVAFLQYCKQKLFSIEKEAYSIVDYLKKWRHYLIGRHFEYYRLEICFIFNKAYKSKIKNEKIIRWRLELSL